MTISQLFAATDWTLLKQQKELLLNCCDQHPELEGLVDWITDLQEMAEQKGFPVEWLTEDVVP